MPCNSWSFMSPPFMLNTHLFEVFELVFTISHLLNLRTVLYSEVKLKGVIFVSDVILVFLPAHRKQEKKN